MRSHRDPPPTAPEVRELTPGEWHNAMKRLELKSNPLEWWGDRIEEGICCAEPFLTCYIYRLRYCYTGARGCAGPVGETLVFVPSAPLRPTRAWQLPEWITQEARTRWPTVTCWKLVIWETRLERVTVTIRSP
ncbi:hypothetical protein HYW17_05400 [Candidatus Uhrbacteria bacterium]|nr:hypothetical protein [Candidatus Uhrbacteria bacterium]